MSDGSADISIPNVSPEVPLEETDINAFRRKYKEDAKALLNYKDPIPFPFISSTGEGSDKLTVLPSPHIRVFIMGYEVSAWLSNATWGGESTPKQLNSPNNITLKCPRDLFTLTHDNIFLNSWNLNDDFKTSEQVKKALYDWKSDKNVYEEKTLLGTWSLTVNTCIFHTSDTVRIFAHIPWTEDDAWLPVFNGYVHNVNISTDMLNGMDTIVIDLETIANKLTTARFLNNPYSRQILNQGNTAQRPPSDTIFVEALDPNNSIIKDKSAQKIVNNLTLYKDVVNPTLYQSILTNTTLERVLSFLFYGEIDLSYRSELSGSNPTIKDMSIPFDEFEYTNSKNKTANDKEFLQAFSNQISTITKPTLGAVINQQQIFNNERLSLEERQSSEPTIKESTEPGGPLWKAANDFDSSLWGGNNPKKYKSLIWKLQILTHVINATLEKKSTAPKKNLDDASISLTIGDKFINTNVSQEIIDQENKGLLTGATVERGGFGYIYQDFEAFGGKIDSENLSIAITKNPPNDYYTISDDVNFPNDPKDIGTLVVKIQDGSFVSAKIDKPGKNYESKNKERSFKIVFKKPTNSLEGEIEYIDSNTFNLSSVFTDRYSDFLYKRGWGYLDPRLFSYHRVEFPRTGFPDAQLKELERRAEEKKGQKTNQTSAKTTTELKTDLKKELANQLVLKSFLKDNGMETIGNTIEETPLGGLYIPSKYNYDERQIDDNIANRRSYSKIGIPLAAYDAANNLIELYQRNDWYDETEQLFNITNLIDNPELVFRVEQAQRKFLLPNSESTTPRFEKKEGNYEAKNGDKFGLSTPELTSKLRSAQFIYVVGEGIFKLENPEGGQETLRLWAQDQAGKNPKETAKLRLKMIVPPKLNLTNNSVVLEEDGSIKNIYSIVKDFYIIGTNQKIVDIIKLMDPTKETEVINRFTDLIFNNQKDQNKDSIKKSIAESIFGGYPRFTSPLNSKKEAVGQFADQKKQYSYDWLNGGLSKLTKSANPEEFSHNLKNETVTEASGKELLIGAAKGAFIGFAGGIALGPPGMIEGAVIGAVVGAFAVLLGPEKGADQVQYNTEKSKIYFQQQLRAVSNQTPLYGEGVYQTLRYKFWIEKNNLRVLNAYSFNYIKGPVFTFSTNANTSSPVKIYNIKPNKYNKESNIPPSFMAWAVLAYKYYESRTGITSEQLNATGVSDTLAAETKDFTINFMTIGGFTTEEKDPIEQLNTKFIPIQPKFEDNWYDLWTKNSLKDSYFSKTYDNIEKNKTKQQELVKKGNQQYIYKYVQPAFKQICFNPIKGNSKQPFNIFKIIDAYGTLEDPTLDQITERSRGSEKYDEKKSPSPSNIPPGDPNYDSAKPLILEHSKNVNFFAPLKKTPISSEDEIARVNEVFYYKGRLTGDQSPPLTQGTFDVVAPIDGFIQFVENKEGAGLVQFMSFGGEGKTDNTIHEFSYVGKEVKIGVELRESINITNLDNLHWDKVKECGIYDKNAKVTITSFLQNARKAGVESGQPDDPTALADSTLKRLTAIWPSAYDDWANAEIFKINKTDENNKKLSKLLPSIKNDIFSSYGNEWASEKGRIWNELKDFDQIFSGDVTQGYSSENYFNKIKYTNILNKYEKILSEIEYLKTNKDGLGSLDDSNKNQTPNKLQGYESVADYKFGKAEQDYVFYAEYKKNNGSLSWSISVYEDWDTTKSRAQPTAIPKGNLIVKNNAPEELETFITNLKTIIDACKTKINAAAKDTKKTEKYLKPIKQLEAWYETKPKGNDNTYGAMIDAEANAIEKNSASPLDTLDKKSEITKSLTGFKKGSVIIENVDSITWSVYKVITSIENLDYDLLYEETLDSYGNPKFKTGSDFFKVLSPWAWLNDSLGKKDSAEQYNAGNKEIDWAYEEYFMADWHRKCVVGFSNGIPKDSLTNYNSDEGTNNLYADAIDCAKAAKGRLNSWLTYDEVTIIGKNSGWFGIYSPHGKTVTVALRSPKYGWGINGGIEQLVFQTMSYESNTESKAEILTRLLDRLDYHWWVNGNGDVIVDFPHYELIPSHYGPKWESFFQLQNLSTLVTYTENFKDLSSLYYYKGGYGIVPTASDAQIQQNVSVVFHLPNVMVRNGIIPVVETFQWITDKERLKKFGLIQLKKRVLNSFIISMSDLPPILYMTPNTPIYMADRDIFGLVASVRFNWTIAEGSVTYRLSPQLTAIKQRLNYEQLALEKFSKDKNFKNKIYGAKVPNVEKNNENEEIFKISYQDFIKPVYDNATKRIEAVSYYSDTSKDKIKTIIKSTEVLGFTLSKYNGVILDTKETGSTLDKRGNLSIENDRLKLIQNNYGYVYGNKEPILDYTATYSQNQYVLGTKWEAIDNTDPANTYSVLTDHVQGKNIDNTVKILNELNKPKVLSPISGELAKSLDAAAKVLKMTENDLAVLKETGLNPDLTSLSKETQNQINGVPNDGSREAEQTKNGAIYKALTKEFIERLKIAYPDNEKIKNPEFSTTDLNKTILAALNLKSYGTDDLNPGLLAACKISGKALPYAGSKDVELNIILGDSTASLADVIINNLIAYKGGVLTPSTTNSADNITNQINADIEVLTKWKEDQEGNSSGKSTGTPVSQSIMKYPTTVNEIKAFQKEKNLTDDGKLGPKTMRALGLAGIAPKTTEEIKVFQKANKLEETGNRDDKTNRLIEEYSKPGTSEPTFKQSKSYAIVGDSIASALNIIISDPGKYLYGPNANDNPYGQQYIWSGLDYETYKYPKTIYTVKIDTWQVEKNIKIDANIKGKDVVFISTGSYNGQSSLDDLVDSLKNIKISLKAKKYYWIIPYTTTKTQLSIFQQGNNNPQQRMIEALKKIGETNFLNISKSAPEGVFEGIHPDLDSFKLLYNQIKSVAGLP